MVFIHADNVRLSYTVRQKLSLAWPRRRLEATGGRIVSKGRHHTVTALDGISFDIAAGDRLGLVGSNGSGKTTLLKVLYGIFEPTAGRIETHGRADALFNISLGFRKEATGRRNIVLRGLVNGWTPDEIESRMDAIIDFSELGEFIDLPFKAYSQGMSARLAFSVATSLEPEILLMDEWIGAGDASFQEKAKKRMAAIAEKAGIIVLASHNTSLLQRTCNKILELEKGRVKYFGDAEEWFAKNTEA
ncbi:MAG: O-antigen export system ATP-binding protein rfbE [Devosia sp.]|nr:O-antigen export system ATP-binding protein rfbE [Devosia sp.]